MYSEMVIERVFRLLSDEHKLATLFHMRKYLENCVDIYASVKSGARYPRVNAVYAAVTKPCRTGHPSAAVPAREAVASPPRLP
jgi:hypothetical protein